jgi:hypothetical protein
MPTWRVKPQRPAHAPPLGAVRPAGVVGVGEGFVPVQSQKVAVPIKAQHRRPAATSAPRLEHQPRGRRLALAPVLGAATAADVGGGGSGAGGHEGDGYVEVGAADDAQGQEGAGRVELQAARVPGDPDVREGGGIRGKVCERVLVTS